MDKNELNLLAKKFMDGTATAEEHMRLNQWYDAAHLTEGEEIVVRSEESADETKKRIFAAMQQKLHPVHFEVRPKSTAIKRLVQVAAVAAVLTIGFFTLKPKVLSPPATGAEKQVINVPANRVLHITLPDGSKVWLNAGSVFRYPKSFSDKDRTVELVEGRAFFDILHQAARPFIVKTKNLNVTVLGTSFDVRSYKKEGETRVSVITGKVGITMPNSKNKGAIFLLPKQAVVLSNVTNQFVKQAEHQKTVTAWVKNNTVFEQESLENIFKALEKEYNTTIKVENKKLLSERISIVLGNQHLDSIIQVLSYTKNFKYQIANDSTVVIR